MPLSSLQPRMRAALELDMDYAKPADVVASMIDASLKKLALSPRDLLIRGALSGALLGAATALAVSGAITTGQPLVGALIFPVSLGMIEPAGVAARIISIAEAKTVANEALGAAGMVSVFVKAILCNWLVCLGVVMAMTSNSTVGKNEETWLQIFNFLKMGIEQ